MNFVYCFQLKGTPFYKFGYSSNPKRRLREINKLLNREVLQIMVRQTPEASRMEYEIHKLLEPYRDLDNSFACSTEWFRLNDDLLNSTITEIDKMVIHQKAMVINSLTPNSFNV